MPLHIILPKMGRYLKGLMKLKACLQKYNEILDKIRPLFMDGVQLRQG